MEQTKHTTMTFGKTIDIKRIQGKKVLTSDGKQIGKIKSIHIHPGKLSVEGIIVDPGMFEVDHYIDSTYIKSLSNEGAVLNMNPATEIVGLTVFDSLGKKIGKIEEVNRSKLSNKIISIRVEGSGIDKECKISADYIAAIGTNVMLKEPYKC